MDNKELLENLSRLGVSLLETERDFNVNKTLAGVVQSKEPRYWEAFPVLLANAAKDENFDYQKVLDYLKDDQGKQALRQLFLLSLAVYKFNHLKFGWADRFYSELTDKEKNKVGLCKDYLAHNHDLGFAGHQFSAQRLKGLFNNYFKEEAQETKKLRSQHEELSLEYSLSQVFSPKQKELFRKKLEGKPLTKTEREYFSRSVKKKVQALANPELHRLAQRLLE
ncbi:hypothetical protein ACFL2J_02055 [Candidatus Omnitrophota bacterium]